MAGFNGNYYGATPVTTPVVPNYQVPNQNYYIPGMTNYQQVGTQQFVYVHGIDGSTVPATTMTVTPAAVEEFFNVSRAANIDIWNGCCESVAVRNTSDIPILVQNANILFSRPDLALTK